MNNKKIIRLNTVLNILAEFEAQANKDVKLDRAIDADPYESIGRLKLIKKITTRMKAAAI